MVFENLLQLYHLFNLFLGTAGGELLKAGVEFFVLLIVAYMITSEWTRTKAKELFYLIISFSFLALQKLIIIVVFAHVSFLGYNYDALAQWIFPISNFFEILGMLLIGNSFTSRLFRKKAFENVVKLQTYVLIGIFFILFFFWYSAVFPPGEVLIRKHLFFFVFQMLKIFSFTLPIILILNYTRKIDKYFGNAIIAFLIYMVNPVIHIVNYIFYDSRNASLLVLSHPWPFIAILLFTRVIYLKLVDKATLRKQVKTAKEKLAHEKELGRLKDSFISVVSHELKTPITSIKLYLDLLLKKTLGPLNNQQKKLMERVKRESMRLSHIIDDHLTVSRIQDKKLKLNITKYDLSDLAKDISYKKIANQEGIRLQFDIPSNFTVKIDPQRFKQVFINLLTNALKFTKKKGKITVRARKNAHHFTFTVKDNGVGIPKNDIPKLFDKFYQVESHMTRSAGGSGLGLAIVKGIVELHNGTIDVKSQLGKGSEFIVKIPQ